MVYCITYMLMQKHKKDAQTCTLLFKKCVMYVETLFPKKYFYNSPLNSVLRSRLTILIMYKVGISAYDISRHFPMMKQVY